MTNQKISWLEWLRQHISKWIRPEKRLNVAKYFDGSSHRPEFIIIGLGRFGTSLAMSLTAYNHEVLAVDSDLNRVQEVSYILPHTLQLDATNIDALREVGVESFDTGIVCIGTDFEANILATVTLRKLGVRRVIAKARTVTQQEILQRVGADEVILPEHEAGVRLARRLAAVDFVDFMELGQDTGVVEIIAPDYLIGKSLRDSQIRQRYGVAVVAVKRGDEVIVSPRAGEVIQKDDILVVLGRIADCERLR
jgi:trk system potassium uptake protein TrkA